jgi:PadR family transcriptional regulator PadR
MEDLTAPYVAFIIGASQVACYIGIVFDMAAEIKLSHTAAIILQTVDAGYVYGFSVMEMTGLPSGTVYPAMRRLERDELIRSHWEQQSIADAEQRPPRKYYKLTRTGKLTLESSRKRYPLLAKLIPSPEEEQV